QHLPESDLDPRADPFAAEQARRSDRADWPHDFFGGAEYGDRNRAAHRGRLRWRTDRLAAEFHRRDGPLSPSIFAACGIDFGSLLGHVVAAGPADVDCAAGFRAADGGCFYRPSRSRARGGDPLATARRSRREAARRLAMISLAERPRRRTGLRA